MIFSISFNADANACKLHLPTVSPNDIIQELESVWPKTCCNNNRWIVPPYIPYELVSLSFSLSVGMEWTQNTRAQLPITCDITHTNMGKLTFAKQQTLNIYHKNSSSVPSHNKEIILPLDGLGLRGIPVWSDSVDNDSCFQDMCFWHLSVSVCVCVYVTVAICPEYKWEEQASGISAHLIYSYICCIFLCYLSCVYVRLLFSV